MERDMLNPMFNNCTDEAHCVEKPVEYLKMQYLEMSDSASSWWHKYQSISETKNILMNFISLVILAKNKI